MHIVYIRVHIVFFPIAPLYNFSQYRNAQKVDLWFIGCSYWLKKKVQFENQFNYINLVKNTKMYKLLCFTLN